MSAVVLLSLVRKSNGLHAWTASAAPDDVTAQPHYAPLAALPLALCPQRDALLADWQVLQSATELATAWPAFWRIFWHTVSDPREQASLAMPPSVAPAAPWQATAAHPRAFRGTKFQPPKQAAPALDLCAWLSDDRLLDGFFARHEFARLPLLDAAGQPCQRLAAPTVIGLLAHRAGAQAAQWPLLPGPFRRSCLWLLRDQPLPVLLAWLAVWRGCAAPAADLLARVCAQSPQAHPWAALALNLQGARQTLFFETLLAQGVDTLRACSLTASELAQIDARADDARFTLYLATVLSNLTRQVSAAYTLQGCTLGDRQPSEPDPNRLASHLRADHDCAHGFLEHIDRMSKAVGPEGQHWELTAWQWCGLLPGFERVLRATCWENLTPRSAGQWLTLFFNLTWDSDEQRMHRLWQTYLALLPTWLAALAPLPGPWQEKYVSMLRSYVNNWDNAATLADSVTHLHALQRQFCQPPFLASSDGDAILSPLAEHLPPAAWQQLAATSQKTWLMIERETRRDNDATLICRGLHSLALCSPDFLMQAFGAMPKRLLRSARLLGCLAYERRRQFLAETAHTVWFATRWADLPPEQACRELSRLCLASGLHSPVPHRLRAHFEGRVQLSARQLARHCRVSLARLPGVQLAALDAAIWSGIDAPFGLRSVSGAASHAVRMLAGLTENRKGLRRFLLAYARGDKHGYRDHPLNRAWFARHPRIDAAAWNGTRLSQSNDGKVTLAFESDPLEILMLGTYAGTCLGLGGIRDESAVACLLDANKQVIYARNQTGQVLARQLVAIDESDRLICFSVYPLHVGEALLQAFDAFNLALAQSLGIEIYRERDDSYHVAVILAEACWDDGVPDRGN